MQLVGPDAAEAIWTVVGLTLLALTAAGLVATARRRDLGWFLVCLALGPLGAAAYFLTRARITGRSRAET